MTLRFNFSGVPHEAGCHSAPPDLRSCGASCAPEPCCNDCPPMVALRDYRVIKPTTAESCFTLAPGICTDEVIHAARNCIEMRIRRRGDCKVLLTLKALRATLEGAACFVWPLEWWRLSDGDYEADVYVNGCTCLTIGLRQVGCNVAISAYSETHSTGCGTPRQDGVRHGVPQPCCVAPLDDTPQALPASTHCEDC